MKRISCVLLVLVFFSAFVAAHASDDINESIKKGMLLIEERKFGEAESIFRGLMESLPSEDDRLKGIKYDLGRALLGQERATEALPLIEPYDRSHPDDPNVMYNYALCLLFTAQYEKSMPLFEEAAKRDPGLLGNASYYTGIALLKLGKREQAAAYFWVVLDWAPDSEVAKSARTILAEMIILAKEELQEIDRSRMAARAAVPNPPTREKPWSIFLSLAGEYDDNVSLLPDATPPNQLPQYISDEGSWRLVYSMGGAYDFFRQDGHVIGINAGYTGTRNKSALDGFDVDSVLGSLNWRYTFVPFQVRANCYYAYTWVGSDPYSTSFGIGPGASWQPVPWTWTDFDYSYGHGNYSTKPLLPQEERDTDFHWFSLRQSFSFNDLLLNGQTTFFSFGLHHSISNTDGTSYDNDSTGCTALFQQGLPWDLTFLCTYTYRDVSYDYPNIRSPMGLARSDKTNFFNISLFKEITDYLTAFLGYRRYENDSNIPYFYEYHNNVYSIGMRLNF